MAPKKGNIPWNKGKKGLQVAWNKGTKGLQNAWNKGLPPSEETRQKISKSNIGKTAWNKGIKGCFSEETIRKMRIANKGRRNRLGKPHSDKAKRKMSASHKGKIPWNKGKSGLQVAWNKGLKGQAVPWNKGITGYKTQPCSDETRKKISKSHIGICTGEKSHFWKGGVSFEPYCPKFNNRLRERIRIRDNRTCQLCGKKENGRKHDAHHIHYLKSDCDPDLITLCINCNSKVNSNRNYYEKLFMNKLKERGLATSTHRKS